MWRVCPTYSRLWPPFCAGFRHRRPKSSIGRDPWQREDVVECYKVWGMCQERLDEAAMLGESRTVLLSMQHTIETEQFPDPTSTPATS